MRPVWLFPRQGASDLRHKTIFSRPLSGSRTVTVRSPRAWFGDGRKRFAATIAKVRRPVPFRTRKLRPCTAMVLHLRGCGRVARRRFICWGFPSSIAPGPPFFLYPRPPLPLVSSSSPFFPFSLFFFSFPPIPPPDFPFSSLLPLFLPIRPAPFGGRAARPAGARTRGIGQETRRGTACASIGAHVTARLTPRALSRCPVP